LTAGQRPLCKKILPQSKEKVKKRRLSPVKEKTRR
jgi:hypothetical protein